MLSYVSIPKTRKGCPSDARATVMYGAGDVRVEDVPDARLLEPGQALVGVTRAAICGSDLWPYKSMEPSGGLVPSLAPRPRRRRRCRPFAV